MKVYEHDAVKAIKEKRYSKLLKKSFYKYYFGFLIFIPFIDLVLPEPLKLSQHMRPILIMSILGIGLHCITGLTGLLNLGIAGSMGIGAYVYAILTTDIYPFQLGFLVSLIFAGFFGMLISLLIAIPSIGLRGDYLAIVTLGFGEIVQDSLKNLDTITKGTQGINPLPHPGFFTFSFDSEKVVHSYYFYAFCLFIAFLFVRHIEHSRIGRCLTALREDEIAASCMGINVKRIKLISFCLSAFLASIAGALWASFLGSTGEPSNYDFQISVITLCMLIVGGIGTLEGVLLGALLMIGLNTIFISQLSSTLIRMNLVESTNVMLNPNNWKYMLFGLALVGMMRIREEGVLGKRLTQANCLN
jgi:branched-chain amino acid transport system permease protein